MVILLCAACFFLAFPLQGSATPAFPAVPSIPRRNCPRLQVLQEDGTCADAIPACQVTQSGAKTDCRLPSSCECYAQCEAVWYLDDLASVYNRECFFANGTLLASLDEALELQWYVYARKWTVAPGASRSFVKAASDPEAGKPVDVPHGLRRLEDCDQGCNGRGWCRKPWGARGAAAECLCFEPFFGPNCSLKDPKDGVSGLVTYGRDYNCWNRCSARGVCKLGVCLCNEGSWGIDCSLPLSNEQPGADIFVYELPPGFNSWWYHLDDRDLGVIVSEYLLRSPYRTTDPEKATVFWLPISPMGRVTYGHGLLALDYVRRTYPYYNRSGGRDHAVAYGWDSGSCWISRHPLAVNTIQVSHFGLQRADKKMSCDCELCGPAYTLLVPDTMEVLYKARTKLVYGKEDSSERPMGIFFSGSLTGDERKALAELVSSPAWAEAVRARWDATKGEVLVNAQQDVNVRLQKVDLFDAMSSAKFCLAPPGAGFGTRGTLAILLGCVPVYIGDIREPWDELDPSTYSLRVRLHELPRLLDIINAANYTALRQGLQKVWHLFSYASIFGPIGGQPLTHDATHMLLAGLRRQAQSGRAAHMRGGGAR